jgi:hypothetical protein
MASFYGHRGGQGNLDKVKSAEHRAHISKALSGKSNDTLAARWNDTLESLKLFIVIKGRMPKQKAADDEERCLGNWIINNKKKEGGTNSKRE